MPYDESWIYCYDPETKRQSSHWNHAGSPKPKKTRQSNPTHKLLMIPFLTALAGSTCSGFPLDRLSTRNNMLRFLKEFRKRFRRERPALFKSTQGHFQQDNAPVYNSILVTDYLTMMGIKTVPQPPYSPNLAPSDFWLFLKLTGCRYETIDEMKEAETKVIDTLIQEDFHGAFQKLLERFNKCIAARGDYFEGD